MFGVIFLLDVTHRRWVVFPAQLRETREAEAGPSSVRLAASLRHEDRLLLHQVWPRHRPRAPRVLAVEIHLTFLALVIMRGVVAVLHSGNDGDGARLSEVLVDGHSRGRDPLGKENCGRRPVTVRGRTGAGTEGEGERVGQFVSALDVDAHLHRLGQIQTVERRNLCNQMSLVEKLGLWIRHFGPQRFVFPRGQVRKYNFCVFQEVFPDNPKLVSSLEI